MFTNHLGFRLKTKHKKQDDVANVTYKSNSHIWHFKMTLAINKTQYLTLVTFLTMIWDEVKCSMRQSCTTLIAIILIKPTQCILGLHFHPECIS